MLIVKTLQGTFGSERLGELLWVAARCGVGWVGWGGSWWWYEHRPRFSGHWLQERDSDAGFPPLRIGVFRKEHVGPVVSSLITRGDRCSAAMTDTT